MVGECRVWSIRASVTTTNAARPQGASKFPDVAGLTTNESERPDFSNHAAIAIRRVYRLAGTAGCGCSVASRRGASSEKNRPCRPVCDGDCARCSPVRQGPPWLPECLRAATVCDVRAILGRAHSTRAFSPRPKTAAASGLMSGGIVFQWARRLLGNTDVDVDEARKHRWVYM